MAGWARHLWQAVAWRWLALLAQISYSNREKIWKYCNCEGFRVDTMIPATPLKGSGQIINNRTRIRPAVTLRVPLAHVFSAILPRAMRQSLILSNTIHRLGHGYGYTPGYPVNLSLDNHPGRFSWVSRCAWTFFVCIIRVYPEIRPSSYTGWISSAIPPGCCPVLPMPKSDDSCPTG